MSASACDGSAYAYAVIGDTGGGDDARPIACYFDNLRHAVDYLKMTRSWEWSCSLYRIKHERMEDSSVLQK